MFIFVVDIPNSFVFCLSLFLFFLFPKMRQQEAFAWIFHPNSSLYFFVVLFCCHRWCQMYEVKWKIEDFLVFSFFIFWVKESWIFSLCISRDNLLIFFSFTIFHDTSLAYIFYIFFTLYIENFTETENSSCVHFCCLFIFSFLLSLSSENFTFLDFFFLWQSNVKVSQSLFLLRNRQGDEVKGDYGGGLRAWGNLKKRKQHNKIHYKQSIQVRGRKNKEKHKKQKKTAKEKSESIQEPSNSSNKYKSYRYVYGREICSALPYYIIIIVIASMVSRDGLRSFLFHKNNSRLKIR